MLLNTPACRFGWNVPDFILSDPDGASYRLEEHLGTQGAVVAFICNHCPYVQAIAGRLATDAALLQDEGIAVLAVMPNDFQAFPADAPAQMKLFKAQHGFTFPYLVDETQAVARAYGAVCTPDFFGVNRDGQLQYRGRLDDARMGPSKDRSRELLTAMRQIAETGRGPDNPSPSMGCSIKWR